MIGIFANPDDHEFVNWIRSAARLAGMADADVQFVKVDREGIRAREYGPMIQEMDACIVDVSYKGLIRLGSKLGALPVGHQLGMVYDYQERYDGEVPCSPFDSRVLLVTRDEWEDKNIRREFGDFYTRFHIEAGIDDAKREGLATWIRETVAMAAPRVLSVIVSRNNLFQRMSQSRFKIAAPSSGSTNGTFCLAIQFPRLSIGAWLVHTLGVDR